MPLGFPSRHSLAQNVSFRQVGSRKKVRSMRNLYPRLLALGFCLSALAICAPSAEAGTNNNVPVLLAKANAGDADAQYQLGNAYNYGQKVRQDFTQALLWYRKGAEQGNADAEFQLGGLYHFGHGVPQDEAQGFAWTMKAAEQGNVDAQFFVSSCYKIGWGVAPNDTQSVAWLRKASEQGDSRSQLYLALAYGTGTGVAKDYSEAYFWFGAAASGETNRKRRKQDIKGQFHTAALLTTAELSDVQKRLQKWLVDHPAQSR
jgi:TPR repeat protein